MSASSMSLLTYSQSSPHIAELLLRAKDERVSVIAFTDEELLALDGPDTDAVAPTFFLAPQPPEVHELLATVAMRSLVARGVVDLVKRDPAAGGADGAPMLALAPDVAAVLAMRSAASAVVVCQQRTAESRRARVLYEQGELGVLEEDVNPGGLHSFSIAGTDVTRAALAGWCNPFSADMPTRPEPQRATLQEVAADGKLSEHLGSALVVSVVAAVLPDGGGTTERRISVYAFADHVEVGAPDPSDGQLMVYRWVDDTELRRVIEDMVQSA